MRQETTTRNLYTFAELPDDIKETALGNLRDINVDYEDWNDWVLDDAKTIGALMGIDIDKIYYSGFWSQGDGACFEGSYSYKKGAIPAVKEYAPKDETLHGIARDLQTIQKKHFYGLSANVSHRGHYQHENCTDISVDYDAPNYQDMSEDAEDAICEALRDFMRWIYSGLESEYDYLTSEAAIKETIEANGYEFTEEGELA